MKKSTNSKNRSTKLRRRLNKDVPDYMANSAGGIKILRLALGTVAICAVFVSGLATGTLLCGRVALPAPCPSGEKAVAPVQENGSAPVVAGGELLRGVVGAVSIKSLTLSYSSSDPKLAKEMTVKEIGISPETLVKERTRLSQAEVDALVKKTSEQSLKNGSVYIPPTTYMEKDGRFSDIKAGMEVEVVLAEGSESSQPKALRVYYYSMP